MNTIKQGLAEFSAAKKDLEDRLRVMIAAEVDAFHELTGATIGGIEVHTLTVRTIAAPTKRLISSVRVSTPLD